MAGTGPGGAGYRRPWLDAPSGWYSSSVAHKPEPAKSESASGLEMWVTHEVSMNVIDPKTRVMGREVISRTRQNLSLEATAGARLCDICGERTNLLVHCPLEAARRGVPAKTVEIDTSSKHVDGSVVSCKEGKRSDMSWKAGDRAVWNDREWEVVVVNGRHAWVRCGGAQNVVHFDHLTRPAHRRVKRTLEVYLYDTGDPDDPLWAGSWPAYGNARPVAGPVEVPFEIEDTE